jgi:superfamily II DNA or RNA helicase/diadenosine tetraphosphate (Ap4A) HIT family hydrolase
VAVPSVFSLIPPTEYVASNKLAYAIRDQYPVSPGHTLIIPKREISTWWDASESERQAILQLVNVVRANLMTENQPDGFNVGFNAGEAAGQTIDHLHIHVIPRYNNDMSDPRGGVRHVIPEKGNYLAPNAIAPKLTTPKDRRLFNELVKCLADESLDRVDLLISFVMKSGVDVLKDRILQALDRGAHIRLLTTDYLETTDVSALGFFLDRLHSNEHAGNLEVKIFSSPKSFHPKAYLFYTASNKLGTSFVGSSNLSRSGLQEGVEWNLKTDHIDELINEFEMLWNDRHSTVLTEEWLAAYEQRKKAKELLSSPSAEVGEVPEQPIAPWGVQREALAALEATRIAGHAAGLVVMATGLGKTWLAAFDTTRPQFKRVLFIAHREEILNQTRDVFRRARPGAKISMFIGGKHDASGEVVIASVQSLAIHLSTFDPTQFDYVVIDEFHHAAAKTYRKVISHFQPKFLLGLTATPDRTDAADLLVLCGDNLVYECNLIRGINLSLLSNFHYRAIKDVADYEHIPWSKGKFNEALLSAALETEQRAKQVLDEWNKLEGPNRRTLGFCCSIAHAEYMAKYFADQGIAALAVHSGSTTNDRLTAVEDLADGKLHVLFSVDLFNEGLDVPAVDVVLMLRPTESPIIFFQQLGRGLRKSEGKEHLDVLDLMGNHKSFLMKARLLAGLDGESVHSHHSAIKKISEPMTALPDGCSIVVDLEAVDLLEQLAGGPTPADQLDQLIQEWKELHDDLRPTATEVSLVTGKSLDLRRFGGWFGFLKTHGHLDNDESVVFDLVQDFFLEVEHGAYTKSFKLITLQAMLDLDGFEQPKTAEEIAYRSKEIIFKDPRLLNELSNAVSQFVDVWDPKPAEWLAYWNKNPLNAWLNGGVKGSDHWFELVDDEFRFKVTIPENHIGAFKDLLAEIVEYRLHRYLKGKELPSGEITQISDDAGESIDARFVVHTLLDQPIGVLFKAAGADLNRQYVPGLDLLLNRLANIGAIVNDAYVDSGVVRTLPIADRRLGIPKDLNYPIELSSVSDLVGLRRSMLNSMASIGQSPTARPGGGNSRKAMTLLLGNVQQYPTQSLVDYLSGRGPAPLADSNNSDVA